MRDISIVDDGTLDTVVEYNRMSVAELEVFLAELVDPAIQSSDFSQEDLKKVNIPALMKRAEYNDSLSKEGA